MCCRAHRPIRTLNHVIAAFFAEVRAAGDLQLPHQVADLEHGKHLPPIERRCRGKKRKCDGIVIRNDGEYDIRFKRRYLAQLSRQAFPDFNHWIGGELDQLGNDGLAIL